MEWRSSLCVTTTHREARRRLLPMNSTAEQYLGPVHHWLSTGGQTPVNLLGLWACQQGYMAHGEALINE